MQHVVGRHVDKVRPLIEDLDPHASGQQFLELDLGHFRGDPFGRGEGLFVLAHHDDAFDDVILRAASHDPLAGSVADDDLGHLADIDGRTVGRRGDDNVPDIIELLGFDLGSLAHVRGVKWVFAAAQEPDGADVM